MVRFVVFPRQAPSTRKLGTCPPGCRGFLIGIGAFLCLGEIVSSMQVRHVVPKAGKGDSSPIVCMIHSSVSSISALMTARRAVVGVVLRIRAVAVSADGNC